RSSLRSAQKGSPHGRCHPRPPNPPASATARRSRSTSATGRNRPIYATRRSRSTSGTPRHRSTSGIRRPPSRDPRGSVDGNVSVTVFLCGDVMTGRGVDQILPHPGDPRLWEGYVRDARGYVKLAEAANGPIPAPVPVTWPWGDALAVLDQERPDARIINLETSITSGGEPAPGKGIHYRMSPANIGCIAAARPDVCALANNHVLDFGYQGLAETLDTLAAARISMAGAGRDAADANRPATVAIPERGRLVVRSVGTRSSGIPHSWAATGTRPGVALLADRPDRAAYAFGEELASAKEPGDIVVVSIHWGPNWGYSVSTGHVELAHLLIDSGADVVHGHSSHHARPIEVYRDRL